MTMTHAQFELGILTELMESVGSHVVSDHTKPVVTSDRPYFFVEGDNCSHKVQVIDEKVIISDFIWWPGPLGPSRCYTGHRNFDLADPDSLDHIITYLLGVCGGVQEAVT